MQFVNNLCFLWNCAISISVEGFVISSCEKTIHTIHHKLIINKQISSSGSALVSVTSLINFLISNHRYVKRAVNITSMSVCVFRLQGVLRAVCGQSALGLSHSYDPPLHGCGLVLWVWPRGSERHRHHSAELLWSHQSSRGDAWCLHHVSSYLHCWHIKWCHLLVFYLSLQAGKWQSKNTTVTGKLNVILTYFYKQDITTLTVKVE